MLLERSADGFERQSPRRADPQGGHRRPRGADRRARRGDARTEPRRRRDVLGAGQGRRDRADGGERRHACGAARLRPAADAAGRGRGALPGARRRGAEAPPQFVSQTNATLIRIGGELILVDAGSGPNFQATAGRLSQNLEAAGIDPETIVKVVFTHGHADHLWGALDDFEDAERFPNASYVIPAAEWDFWTDPDTPGRLPDWLKGMARGSARVLRKIEPKVERRRPGEAVAPGLTYLDTAGHTPGHMAVMAESRGERLLVGGDALNNPVVSFARPDWPFGSDLDRDAAASTRRTLLDRLAGDRIPLIGFHLPWPGIGRVARQGSGYRFELA